MYHQQPPFFFCGQDNRALAIRERHQALRGQVLPASALSREQEDHDIAGRLLSLGVYGILFSELKVTLLSGGTAPSSKGTAEHASFKLLR